MPQVEVLATNRPPAAVAQVQPRSITVLAGDTFQLAGVKSLAALARATPGFAQSHAGLRSFSDNYVIRGIGNTDFLGDPGVVVYVDGAPFGDALTFTTDLLAIDRVEIFRGPQGTQFGKSAAAGVIDITTKQPSNNFEATGGASFAAFSSQVYQARFSAPLVRDKLFLSVAGQRHLSDGYIDNVFLDEHADERASVNARGALQWHAGFFFSTLEPDYLQDNSFFIPPNGPGGRDVVNYTQDAQAAV